MTRDLPLSFGDAKDSAIAFGTCGSPWDLLFGMQATIQSFQFVSQMPREELAPDKDQQEA